MFENHLKKYERNGAAFHGLEILSLIISVDYFCILVFFSTSHVCRHPTPQQGLLIKLACII
jgi:hypothetical protein